MTLSDEILKLQSNLADSYTACSGKGATIPANQNFDNLPDCIDSIQSSTPAVITSLTITPSTTQQVITVPSGTDGYNPITVDAVTSSIDSNIVAGNIKDGVSILGVTGTYTGGGGVGGSSGIIIDVNGYNSSGYNILKIKFDDSITEYNLSLRGGASNGAFTDFESVDFNNIKTIKGKMLYAFNGKSSSPITSINVSNIETVITNNLTGNNSQTAFRYAFRYVDSGTIVNFTKLKHIYSETDPIDSSSFNYAFRNCSGIDIRFPALEQFEYNNYTYPSNNAFSNMLNSSSGATVHFPANMQSVMSSWSNVTNGFGGTNTTVLFDL